MQNVADGGVLVFRSMEASINGSPKISAGWFMENPMKTDDLGLSHVGKPPYKFDIFSDRL
jgi:hypothetical protein